MHIVLARLQSVHWPSTPAIMAGLYNRLTLDPCFEAQQDELNEKQYDYVLTRNAVMRQNVTQAPFLSAGRQPDFYGALTGNRVTRESFLQGRGHTVNRCPGCQVVYLPTSLFPEHDQTRTTCDRVDLESMYTRVPKSCNGISETDVTAFRQSPENFKKGFQGYAAVVGTQIQSRVGAPQMQVPFDPCRQNYGSYAPQRDMSRYSG